MKNSINPIVKQFLIEYNAQSDIDQYKKGVGKKVDSIIYVRVDLEVSMKELGIENNSNLWLRKIFDTNNGVSGLSVGDEIGGLIKSASVHRGIEFLNGGHITNIKNIFIGTGGEKIYIETGNSIYLLESITKGLNTQRINLSDGYIQLPESIDKIVPKTNENITEKGLCGDSLHIEIEELKKCMFSVEGSELFTTFSGRIYCLIKIGGIHIPFYASSEGTGGKNKNRWYPAFGVDKNNWIIKGGINKETKNMDYSILLDYYSSILNKNFHIPEKVDLASSGKRGYYIEGKGFIESFDLSNYFNIQEVGNSRQILEKFGYFPGDNISRSSGNKKWIQEIISNI